ncbi:hypothetical protein FQN60_015854, partial [Etheostoma spectabile]
MVSSDKAARGGLLTQSLK